MPRTLTTQVGMLTASRVLGQILNAVAGFVIVRVLFQYDYGTYRQILLLFTTLYLIGDAAFAQSLYHFVPRERDRASIFLGQAMLVVVVLSAVWAGGLMAFSERLAAFFGNPALASHMALLSVLLSLNLLTKIPEVGLVTLQRIGASSLNIAVFESLKFVMVVAVLKWRPTIDAILLAMSLATAMRLAALLVQMRDTPWFALTPRMGEQFRYSMALCLPGLLNNAGIYAHQYIVGHLFSPLEYAIYAVACFQIPLIGALGSSINDVLLVRAAEYRSKGRHEDLYKLWLSACRKAQTILLPITVAFAVLAVPLITLFFTARYVASAPLFVLILLGLPFSGIFQDGIFRACVAMRAYSVFYVLRLALGVGLGLLGAKYFGLMGAAGSSLLALFILNALQLIKVAELLQKPMAQVLPWKDLGRIAFACVIAGIPAGACAWLIHAPWLALAAGLLLYGAAYVAIATRFGLISWEEVRRFFQEVNVLFGRLTLHGKEI